MSSISKLLLMIVLNVMLPSYIRCDIPPLSDVVEQLLSNSSSYRYDLRPGMNEDIPTRILVGAHMDHLGKISESDNEFTVTIYLRFQWYDKRLAYEHIGYRNRSIALHHNAYHRLWVPDLFASNLKTGEFHTLTVPNRLFRLNSDGLILYSQRLTLTLACNMNLRKYPMDEQKCTMQFESYGHTTDDIIALWNPSDNFTHAANITQPEYDFYDFETEDCTAVYSTGTYTCLRVSLMLKRRLTVYILSVYIPSLLVVILSWMSFWIDLESVPARISLAIITILTITTQTFSNTRGLFTTSIVKALDVWMAVCLVYVFGAFLEYAVVNTYNRKARRQAVRPGITQGLKGIAQIAVNIQNMEKGINSNSSSAPKNDSATMKVARSKETTDNSDRSYFSKLRKNEALFVDVISRICFPLTFLIFNFIYWPLYWNLETF